LAWKRGKEEVRRVEGKTEEEEAKTNLLSSLSISGLLLLREPLNDLGVSLEQNSSAGVRNRDSSDGLNERSRNENEVSFLCEVSSSEGREEGKSCN